MAVVLNPTTFNITDTLASVQSITGLKILVGTVSGGPYTAGTFNLTAAEVSAGLASGNFTGTLASIGENLGPGTYFAVAEAVNTAGTSANSPEVSIQVLAAPTAPTVFIVA